MQSNSVLLESLSVEQLKTLIGTTIKSSIQEIKDEISSQSANEELLTREQACELLQINASTLWHWQNKLKVTAYSIANKRYYKRSELMECLKPLKK